MTCLLNCLLNIKYTMNYLSGKGRGRNRCSFFIFISVVTSLLICFFMYKQYNLFTLMVNERSAKYQESMEEYSYHQCENMITTNDVFSYECNRLSMIIKHKPLPKAIDDLIQYYKHHSCFFMDCIDLMIIINDSTLYQILLLFMCSGWIYNVYMIGNFVHILCCNIIEYYRRRKTDEVIRNIMN